jgi:hypothetical protein
MHDPLHVGIQEVATHSVAPSVPQQFFKSPANVLPRTVSIQPPIDPTLIVPNPSPPVVPNPSSNTTANDDELLLACLQSMQS